MDKMEKFALENRIKTLEEQLSVVCFFLESICAAVAPLVAEVQRYDYFVQTGTVLEKES